MRPLLGALGHATGLTTTSPDTQDSLTSDRPFPPELADLYDLARRAPIPDRTVLSVDEKDLLNGCA
jgi:hypothetical protein